MSKYYKRYVCLFLTWIPECFLPTKLYTFKNFGAVACSSVLHTNPINTLVSCGPLTSSLNCKVS